MSTWVVYKEDAYGVYIHKVINGSRDLAKKELENFVNDSFLQEVKITNEFLVELIRRDVDLGIEYVFGWGDNHVNIWEYFGMVETTELNEKENKPMVEQTKEKEISSFIDDAEKMRDFIILSKEDFLKSYSYINEGSYDLTKKEYDSMRGIDLDYLAERTGVRKIYIVSQTEANEDKIIKKAFKSLPEARVYLFQIIGEYISNKEDIYDVHKNELNDYAFLDVEVESDDGISTWFTLEETVLE